MFVPEAQIRVRVDDRARGLLSEGRLTRAETVDAIRGRKG